MVYEFNFDGSKASDEEINDLKKKTCELIMKSKRFMAVMVDETDEGVQTSFHHIHPLMFPRLVEIQEAGFKKINGQVQAVAAAKKILNQN